MNITLSKSQSQESGISAVCKKLSEYFVKIIIIVSLFVLIIWYILLGIFTIKFYSIIINFKKKYLYLVSESVVLHNKIM